MSKPEAIQGSTQAGYDRREWCRGAKIGASTLYTLAESDRPRSVKIGKRTIIIEAPADWLERMAAQGGVQTSRQRT